jgi:hypothetical protein
MSQDLTDHKGRNVGVGLRQVVPVQRPSIVGLGVDSAVVAKRGWVWSLEGPSRLVLMAVAV